jgi:hypothetical protein
MASRLRLIIPLLLLALAVSVPAAALAQGTATLELSVRRNVGYSGVGEIQGSFRMEAVATPDDVIRVTFFIDNTIVGIDPEAPFRVDFNTEDYPLGPHTLLAEGDRANGSFVTSEARQFTFVSEAASWDAAKRILVPIFSIVVGAIVLAAGLATAQVMLGKRHPVPLGKERKYGLLGGAICPKCGRPFSRHWWALNAGLSKFDRCDHCGKWSLVRALPLAQLRAAEAAELKSAGEGAGSVPELSPEERLRRQLEDSRYTDQSP